MGLAESQGISPRATVATHFAEQMTNMQCASHHSAQNHSKTCNENTPLDSEHGLIGVSRVLVKLSRSVVVQGSLWPVLSIREKLV